MIDKGSGNDQDASWQVALSDELDQHMSSLVLESTDDAAAVAAADTMTVMTRLRSHERRHR